MKKNAGGVLPKKLKTSHMKTIVSVLVILGIGVSVFCLWSLSNNHPIGDSVTQKERDIYVTDDLTSYHEKAEETEMTENGSTDSSLEATDVTSGISSPSNTPPPVSRTTPPPRTKNNAVGRNIENVESTGMNIPYTISDSNLSIDYLNSYSGIFLEDGSNRDLDAIAAIQLTNKSDKTVEYGQIILRNGDENLDFSFSSIPAGSSVVVMEKNALSFGSSKNIAYVDSMVAYLETPSKLDGEITAVPSENNGITLTNITGKDIPCVRVFYKYVLDSTQYIGGITYTAKVLDIKAGEKRVIYPSHYEGEGSRIMMVRKYDTAD